MPGRNVLRNFEEANPEKAKLLENEILHNVDYSQEEKGKPYCFKGTFSFFLQVLPPLQHKNNHYIEQWCSAVCDLDMKDDLERNGVINWCPKASRLFPIRVKGDGNCLIHALSVAVWGIEDTQLNLRRLLSITLIADPGQRFQSRWKQYQKSQDREMFNRPSLNYVTFDDEHWTREWAQVLHSARGDPAAMTGIAAMPYTQLEAVHVYVLANIFRRPIILLGIDSIRTFSGSSMQTNNLMGIYLPLDRDPSECYSTPIILGFSMNHFCPLIGPDTQFDIDSKKTYDYIPLITSHNAALPVRFLKNADEEKCANDFLKKYLQLKEFTTVSGSHVGAMIEYKPMPPHLNLLNDYQEDFEKKYAETFSQTQMNREPPEVRTSTQRSSGNQMSVMSQLNAQNPVTAVPPSSNPAATDPLMQVASNVFTPVPCKTPNCEFFGNPAQGGMCTRCLQEHLKSESSRMNTANLEAAGVAEPQVAVPSAPPPSMPLESGCVDISMMGELCHGKCGYRCSVNTYPYCHDCAEKNRREALNNQQRDPVVAETPPRQPPSAGYEANMSAGVANETTKMNQQHIAENSVVGISAGELFGSGQQFNAPMQESSVIPCITPQCSGKGKMLQGNRCSRCFVENVSPTVATPQTLTETKKMSIVPPVQQTPMVVELSLNVQPISGSFSKCVTPECGNVGFPANSGYCPGCAIKKIEASISASSSSGQTRDEDPLKMICCTPGCEDMRQRGEWCDKCYHQVHRGRQSPVENLAMAEIGESNELETSNLIESGTPAGCSIEEQQAPVPYKKKKCASPMCSTMIYPPASLCDSCLTILRKSCSMQSSVPKESCSQPVSEHRSSHTAPVGKRCIMPNCNKLGNPDTVDMCMACYQFQFESNRHPTASMQNAGINNAPIVVPGPRELQRAHTAPHGKKCIMEGCAKYGDPATGNMCTACYHRYGAASLVPPARAAAVPSAVPPVVPPARPAAAVVGQASAAKVVEPDERFKNMMSKVENTLKIQKMCKAMSCSNYGNPAKEGFCNSCYIGYQRMQNNTGKFGENRCG